MKSKNLINTLLNCAAHCTYCADACLNEDNLEAMITCIRLDKVCKVTCLALTQALSVDISKKNIEGLVQYCQQICNLCAEECEKHEAQHCKDCAEACRKCAEACKAFNQQEALSREDS